MREAVVAGAVRTAVGKRNGGLSGVHPVDLSADVLTALAARTGLDPVLVDDVIWGCVGQVGDQAGNIARFAVLAAGWPEARLKPSFAEDGVIHAGNSSQISDGAAALLITTPERAATLGLTPIVRYHTGVVAGADPVLMLTAPIPATEKLLKRSGVALGEIGVFEVNEAFAPVPLAWLAETGADPDRVNPLGGAIALGHPLGASGAVLMTRMIYHMRDHDLRYGLQTMCEGGGTANATLVELAQ